MAAWLNHEAAQGHVEQSEEVRHLSTRPAIHGKLGRDARWGRRDKVREFVLKLWVDRAWRSKAEFARSVVDEVRAYGKTVGFPMSSDNALRLIREWVTDEGTSSP